ncbi:hypothetical protein SESBI_43773 [Sesbania bispinosa]|nr:hypothetical protein SESBI_43773 [Sesbania bispinosa]
MADRGKTILNTSSIIEKPNQNSKNDKSKATGTVSNEETSTPLQQGNSGMENEPPDINKFAQENSCADDSMESDD